MKNITKFDISQLAESEEFAKFYKIVRDLTGIVTALAHPDGTLAKRLCSETEYNSICQLILSSKQGREACYSTNQQYCNKVMKSKQGISYLCHAGLIDFAIPVYIHDKQIATINCGQMLPEKPTESGFKKLCEKLKDIPINRAKLRKAYFASNYAYAEKIKTIQELLTFFAEYFCEMGIRLHTANQHQIPDPILTAQNFMKENFQEKITLNDVAEMVGFSDTYFSRLFSKTTGMHFIDYLNNLRLDEAKKLLEKTDWSITQIALKVGFNSLSYFNQIFKTIYSCPPKQYRKQFPSP